MFGTSGIRGPVGETVTAELALSVGRALGIDTDSVVIGRDARDSGRALNHALTAGLMESGTDVIDLGVVATPTAARTVGRVGADAGVVVTASHNPPQDNGLKLWSPSGQAFDEEQRSVIADRMAEQTLELAPWDDHGKRSADESAVTAHRRALVEAGQQWFEMESEAGDDISVAVDVGNGTGGITADALRALGVSVETINGRPDGRFPARPSEPTADTCGSLARFVQAGNADLGVAHDGDADRMMAVDETGSFVPGDLLLAMFAREIAGDGDQVAAPVDTSLIVDDTLADVGAELVHTPVGDVFVAERAKNEGVVFGGEPSGAWIFPDETLCPDGPLAAVRLAVLAAIRPLSERVASFEPYPIRRVSIETSIKSDVMKAVHTDSTEITGTVTTLDGVRVSRDEGWFLVRASGTQPLVRVTAEARDDGTTDQLLEEARALVTAAVEQTEQ